MDRHEITRSFSNAGSRNEVRMRVVNAFASEEPGSGSGDSASRYLYFVETLSSGDRIYLQRPANLHNGFDFLVCVEGANYAPPGKRSRNYPKHQDFAADLQAKKEENGKMYARLYSLLKRVFECEDVSDEEMSEIRFHSGLPADHILKAIKWLFIEQDIRYWNYSGRTMTWRLVPEPDYKEFQVSCKTGPFVKWAGGKKQLLDRLEARMPTAYERYYEPFIGGGALLLHVQPEQAVINDTNEQLLNVYRQLKLDAEAVICAVNTLDAAACDGNRYAAVREQYNAKIRAHELDAECAALMIWINKHCFNGLYRVNSSGLFNVPYNNRAGGASIDAANLRNIGLYLRGMDVEIRQGDFEEACKDVAPEDFVYFDSPYVPISETANFTDYTKDGFSFEDHRRLAALYRRLAAQGTKVMLSNHNVPLVHELYSGFTIEEVDVRRAINSDASKRFGREVIITNY